MKYEHSREDEYLMHHGVPGMKWGVITKEYQPVAFDRRKNRPKKKPSQEEMINRARAHKVGENVGENFFWQARYNQRKREEAARRAAAPKKPDIIDRVVGKGMDQLGIGEFSEMASNFLKDQAKNVAIGEVKKLANKGPTYIKGSKALLKMLSKPADIASKASYAIADKISVGNAVRAGGRFIKGIGKGVWKSGKLAKRGIQWLENGGYARIRHHAVNIRKGISFIRGHAKTAVSFLSKTMGKGTRFSSQAIRSGVKFVQRGAAALVKILGKFR